MQLSLIAQLSEFLEQAFLRNYPTFPLGTIELARSKDPKFGDYQCNSAMKLAKSTGAAPREIASLIVQTLEHNAAYNEMVTSTTVAGPGFINLVLRPSFLAKRLEGFLASDRLLPATQSPQRVVVDFSSPNIAKEMHVGHLRSTIIGDCLARIFERLGHSVLRLNHVGDWGTAFGMLIAYIKSASTFSQHAVDSYSLAQLMQLYRESKLRFDNDALFKKQAQQEVVLLQQGDPTSLGVWKSICATSSRAYQEIYALLGVSIIERGESFYNQQLPWLIRELEGKGVVSLSDGATCLFPEGFTNREGAPLPLMLQKSDGGYTYDTTDMAALAHRIREEQAQRIIYVTDSGQSTHFQMLFKAAEKSGILDPATVRTDHVPFGLVLGPDGKKFKTRSGETERLIDLLRTAVQKAEAILTARNPEWTQTEIGSIAQILGIGAIKYADLSSHRMSDYVFSYDRMLKFEGNTAAFVMYSYVRTLSIQRKIDLPPDEVHLSLEHPAECSLARAVCQFQEVVEEVSDSLLPNRLTEYLYCLAEEFNKFFRDCRVEGDARQNQRLALVSLTGRTLEEGLGLLGIQVPPKM